MNTEMKQCNGMSLSKIEISLPKKSQNFVTAPSFLSWECRDIDFLFLSGVNVRSLWSLGSRMWALLVTCSWVAVYFRKRSNLGSEVKTSDLAAHFSSNSGAVNTFLFTIQTFNEHSRMTKLIQPYLRGVFSSGTEVKAPPHKCPKA